MTSSGEETPRPEKFPGPPQDLTHAGSSEPAAAEREAERVEWGPLTPELVEDEALRGDFVIRWAGVLLAFLLGFTQMAETPTLVHIKTGQYLAAHGFLPPATDVFSYTAADRKWVNQAWGFDLLLAGVFAAGGAVGLTLLKAALAAAVFMLLGQIHLKGSTWWGSVCAVLALLVCHRQFTAQPEIVTLLGTALVLWFLHRWQTSGRTRDLWSLPALLLVWTNLDPRAFLGLAFLVLYASGQSLAGLVGRAGRPERRRLAPLWLAVFGALAAMLVNPFGWQSLRAPWVLFGTEYPALRNPHTAGDLAASLPFLPLSDARLWEWSRIDHSLIAFVLLASFAVVSLVLNARRVEGGHWLLALGALVLASAASREAASAALVLGVVAALNGQAWYLANFRQTYSIEPRERLFSNAGRAVTVLALALLAFLTIAGRLDATRVRPVGAGWHASMRSAMTGLRDVTRDALDDRPFNFVLSEGDLLIWAGRRVFADSRVALYAGGDEDLLDLHDRVRWALRRPQPGRPRSGQPQFWRDVFDRYRVTHVVPRLYGDHPGYNTYFDLLLNSQDWTLTDLGPAAAVFYRNDLHTAEARRFVAEHRFDFLNRAFQTPAPPVPPRTNWPSAPSFSRRYVFAHRSNVPDEIRLAQHYRAHLQNLAMGDVPPFGAAVAHLGTRAAFRGLAEDPDQPAGYLTLAACYEYLAWLEGQTGQAAGVQHRYRRFVQRAAVYGQARTVLPENRALLLRLIELYQGNGKLDLALQAIEQYEARSPEEAIGSDEEQRQQQLREMRQDLRSRVDHLAHQADESLAAEADRLDVASRLYAAGCVLTALDVLDTAPDDVAGRSQEQLLKGILLLEAGRPEAAGAALRPLQEDADRLAGLQWRTPAALVRLAAGDFDAAVALWNEERELLQVQQMMPVLQSLPLVSSPQLWPLHRIRATMAAAHQMPGELAELDFNIALSHLEAGQPKQAATALRRLLAIDPETRLRPLVRFYLYQLTGELIDQKPPEG